jgi:hypothetical protein
MSDYVRRDRTGWPAASIHSPKKSIFPSRKTLYRYAADVRVTVRDVLAREPVQPPQLLIGSFVVFVDRGMEAAWNAVERVGIRRQRDVVASQHLADYAELEAKLAGCAPESLARIQERRGQTNITIPMPYRLALCG